MRSTVRDNPWADDTAGLARRIRIDALRMTSRGCSSHIAAVFSAADILAVLYGRVLRIDPATPDWPDRDRFILSKGHAAPGLYSALAAAGFFDQSILDTHYQDGSNLCGHVSHQGVPGVELSTGSLGHGLSVGVGMAYAAALDERPSRVFVLLGDGELDEGSNWEAVLFAAHHRLGRLVAVIDANGSQSLDTVEATLALEPLTDKWRAFGWHAEEVDGHDHAALTAALEGGGGDRPLCVVARTVKGKGVSFMEADPVLWHYRTAAGQEYHDALRELEGQR